MNTTQSTTAETLADKIAAAAQLVAHTEQDANQDNPEWYQVLRDLRLLAETIASTTQTAVKAAREAGTTWESVALALDMGTRQAAQQRFGGAR